MNTNKNEKEFCIANDDGLIEGGFYDLQEAIEKCVSYGDGCFVASRDLYDENGNWADDQEPEA
jgi:hypothetical protein